SDESGVRSFLQRAVEAARTIITERCSARQPLLLTGAGSVWYDVVAEIFSNAGFGDEVEVVLRPGCYLTHDLGIYRDAQVKILQRSPIARQMHSELLPALHVWAYVLSLPEPGRAIVGMGKRDVAFDAGMPLPALQYRPGDASPIATPRHWAVIKLMDQH